MNTERLFKDNVYLKECGAVVTGVYDCPASKGGPEDLAVTLDRTVFFPTGGGQSCDTGTLGAFPVAEVVSLVMSFYFFRKLYVAKVETLPEG